MTESFKSQVDFRDKFAKQLEIKVRDLEKADSPDKPPPLTWGFFLPNVGEFVGRTGEPTGKLTVTLLSVIDLESFLSKEGADTKGGVEAAIRERIRTASRTHVLFWIRNAGASGVRNLYGEVLIRAPPDVEFQDSRRVLNPYDSFLSGSSYGSHLDVDDWDYERPKGAGNSNSSGTPYSRNECAQ